MEMLEGKLALGGERTIRHVGNMLQNYTLETHIILLTTVIPINLIHNKKF